MGIARLFLKKLYFFRYNSFFLFCTGSPLYFCEFLLIYNIAQYNIAQYFLWQMKPFPLGCSHVSMELITAKSLSAPRCPASDGAYYGKILIYAPISRYRRGLLRQNPYLRPDIPVSTGLITAKFLICAPISRCRWGLLRQNSFLRPDIPLLTGLITAKSLSVPRCTKVEGIIDLILSHIPAFASSAGYR